MEDERNDELYAILHLSPTATDDEIKRAYRNWAQVYHPDKQLDPQMKDIATENFQKIREAYEILSDEYKRQIYDIYGMEGLKSGLELGPKLKTPDEIREELQKMKQRREEEKVSAHVRPSGSFIANLSVPQFLNGDGILKGMAMASEVKSSISKKDIMVVGGHLGVTGQTGGGVATVMLRRQASSVSSVEVVCRAGLQSLLAVQASRNLSIHSTGTVGISYSVKDRIFYLSNTWTRQLSENTTGIIQLVLGADPNVSVAWQRKEEKQSAVGELKFGPTMFGASGHYTRYFSPKSHGRIGGRIGSNALELELGGGRKISDYSTVKMFCSIGIQGISWRFELQRAGQKLIVPVLLSKALDPLFAASALLLPSSLYALLKVYFVKPFYSSREKKKTLERRKTALAQVLESRKAAMKSQALLEMVATRKRNKQTERKGLVIEKAIYGNLKGQKHADEDSSIENDDLPPPFLDVTIPLNFLIDDSGHLKLHEGIKKSGLMGFCDPCPGEPKQLKAVYSYQDNHYEVLVDDLEALEIPQNRSLSSSM